MLGKIRKAIFGFLVITTLAPRAHAQEGGGGALLLFGAGVVLGENLVSTLLVKSSGEAAGYQTEFLPAFGYGLVGILSAYYLYPSNNPYERHNLWVPLVIGSVAGNLYSLYRGNSKRELTVSLGTRSMGLGPEGTGIGMSVEFQNLRLGLFRGDIGDQGFPGPNFAGVGNDNVERNTASVYSLELEHRRRLSKGLRWLSGVGRTWSSYEYHQYSDQTRRAYWKNTFANYFVKTGLGYILADRFEIDLQVGYMLLRHREREDFLREAGSDYTQDNPLQANLKILLGI